MFFDKIGSLLDNVSPFEHFGHIHNTVKQFLK